jgi:uncharacterized protein
MPQPVVHFEISTKNLAKSNEFYGKLFDWNISQYPGMEYGMVAAAGEKSIGGGIGPVQPGDTTCVTIYVQVDDLQAYLDKATKLGGKAIVPPTPIPGIGAFAMFADLDGNRIGLFKSN